MQDTAPRSGSISGSTSLPEVTPVTVLTGFLGSGKTTLLNALLRSAELADTAVLVNEFGEIGIDHLLVESLDDDVVLLNAGCLCCTIRGDLVASLASLFERRERGEVPAFKRVVVETTGLADPAPILHTLLSHETICDRFVVDGIVTVVAACNGDGHLTDHVEALKQAAVADRLVISKTDIAERHVVEALRGRLRSLNPGAPIIEAIDGAVAPDQLLGAGVFDSANKSPDVVRWLADVAAELGDDLGHEQGDNEGGHTKHRHDVNRHDDHIDSISIEATSPVELHRFVAWVERLFATDGERLLRLKGIIDACGSDVPIVVHGVQHIFHPLTRLARWPDDDRRSRLVLIGRNLRQRGLSESFAREVLSRPQ